MPTESVMLDSVVNAKLVEVEELEVEEFALAAIELAVLEVEVALPDCESCAAVWSRITVPSRGIKFSNSVDLPEPCGPTMAQRALNRPSQSSANRCTSGAPYTDCQGIRPGAT